jgi:hypothetical protein
MYARPHQGIITLTPTSAIKSFSYVKVFFTVSCKTVWRCFSITFFFKEEEIAGKVADKLLLVCCKRKSSWKLLNPTRKWTKKAKTSKNLYSQATNFNHVFYVNSFECLSVFLFFFSIIAINFFGSHYFGCLFRFQSSIMVY